MLYFLFWASNFRWSYWRCGCRLVFSYQLVYYPRDINIVFFYYHLSTSIPVSKIACLLFKQHVLVTTILPFSSFSRPRPEPDHDLSIQTVPSLYHYFTLSILPYSFNIYLSLLFSYLFLRVYCI